MAEAAATQRAKAFLNKQITCFDGMLRDLVNLEQAMAGDDDALDRLARVQQEHRAYTLAMESEIQTVLSEWTTAHVSAPEREEVRALSQKARELAEQLIVLQEKGRELADARLAALRDGLDDVARGRGMLDRYGQGSKGSSSFIDTKA